MDATSHERMLYPHLQNHHRMNKNAKDNAAVMQNRGMHTQSHDVNPMYAPNVQFPQAMPITPGPMNLPKAYAVRRFMTVNRPM